MQAISVDIEPFLSLSFHWQLSHTFATCQRHICSDESILTNDSNKYTWLLLVTMIIIINGLEQLARQRANSNSICHWNVLFGGRWLEHIDLYRIPNNATLYVSLLSAPPLTENETKTIIINWINSMLVLSICLHIVLVLYCINLHDSIMCENESFSISSIRIVFQNR